MRVVIAEDSVLLQAGLAKVLDAIGFEVASSVGNAEDLLRAVAQHRPDVAVVDVRMPPGHTDEGVRAALVIRQQWPDVGVLLLSQYNIFMKLDLPPTEVDHRRVLAVLRFLNPP